MATHPAPVRPMTMIAVTGEGIGLLSGVVIRTAVVLVVLLIGIRIFGQRQLGEMNLHDLLMVLVMANAVQNAMTKGDGHLAPALASSCTLLVLGWLHAVVTSRRPELERYLVGSPLILVRDGRLAEANLKRASITRDELMAAVRKQGLAELDAVALAVAEVDGSISVVPREQPRAAGGADGQ